MFKFIKVKIKTGELVFNKKTSKRRSTFSFNQ
jgi:hypothetical protein